MLIYSCRASSNIDSRDATAGSFTQQFGIKTCRMEWSGKTRENTEQGQGFWHRTGSVLGFKRIMRQPPCHAIHWTCPEANSQRDARSSQQQMLCKPHHLWAGKRFAGCRLCFKHVGCQHAGFYGALLFVLVLLKTHAEGAPLHCQEICSSRNVSSAVNGHRSLSCKPASSR